MVYTDKLANKIKDIKSNNIYKILRSKNISNKILNYEKNYNENNLKESINDDYKKQYINYRKNGIENFLKK